MVRDGAWATSGKGAQAVNSRKDLEAGRTWFNPMFVLPVHLELTLQLGQNALFMADTTIKQIAAREAFYEPFLLTHECTSTPDSLGKIPYKLHETMAKRVLCFLCHFYLRPHASQEAPRDCIISEILTECLFHLSFTVSISADISEAICQLCQCKWMEKHTCH